MEIWQDGSMQNDMHVMLLIDTADSRHDSNHTGVIVQIKSCSWRTLAIYIALLTS
jgi:hypothetical protein